MVPGPLVSVVIPVRNERAHIEGCLESVLSQVGIARLEVLVADGMSTDGTSAILAQRARRDSRIRIVENRGKIVSTGLNAAIREARGQIVIRVDAHTQYAPDYLAKCVEVLESSGADNVGGPWQARGCGYLQAAIALAFQSPFSSGGSDSRRVDYEGPVDSVYLGCWRRATLERLGLFDEEQVRNQDGELNLRLVRAGGIVWQSPKIRSWYSPRSSLLALFNQYVQYGYWRVRVIQKHRLVASARLLAPGGFLACLLAGALVAPIHREGCLLFVAVLTLYLCADLAASLFTCRKVEHWRYLPVMPLVFAAFHVGFGWGFVRGVADFLLLKRGRRPAYGEITR